MGFPLMRTKKILLVDYTIANLYSNSGVHPGGAAVEWYHWIEGFSKNEVNVGVLTHKGTNEIITRKLNFDLIETWDKEKGFQKFKLFFKIIPSFFKAIKNYNPDYLVSETKIREATVFAILSKIFRKKCVHRIASDLDVDDRIRNSLSKFYTWFYYLGLRLSDIIFVQNNYQLEELKKRFPNKKIILLNTPFSLEMDKRVKSKSERGYIAWIGTFRSVKNIPALLNVVKNNPELEFKIAGGKVIKNFTDKKTEQAVNELHKLRNAKFMDYMDYEEIPKFLEGALALMNTSFLEGFSNTFLEAWSVGTPIISTINVNPNGLINSHNLGYIVESYDDLPTAILKMIDMPTDEYSKFSQRCIEYVGENHDSKLLASKFLNYLE